MQQRSPEWDKLSQKLKDLVSLLSPEFQEKFFRFKEFFAVQGSPLWHKFRKLHLGASDAPALMGVSPWKTELQLYEEKTNCNSPSNTDNYATRRGLELEPFALAKFEAETGFLMAPRVLVHKTIPYLSASLDGLEIENKCAVEIKCPGKADHELALKGIVPDKYFPQLQHQMEVAGLTEIYYMSYVSDDDFKILKVQKDYDYTKKLLEIEAEFWKKVQDCTPPKPSENDVIEINDPEWESTVHEFKSYKEELDCIQKHLEEKKQKLIFLANHRSAKGAGVKLTKSIRKGAVDLEKVVELIGVDLEPYRKPSYESWMVTLK